MEIAGYFAAVLIGISLGLIGGGGSILTLPVLVYLFNVNEVLAIVYSLFIVGTTSFAGSLAYFKKGWVDIKVVVIFGIPSVIAVFFTRMFLLPAIPLELFKLGAFTVTKPVLLMLIFALLMIAASYSMIRKEKKLKNETKENQNSYQMLLLAEGLFTGTLTGLIGAGGGFLIIPVLVNLIKMPVQKAIGTSLAIITFSSLAGFLFSLSHHSVDWSFLLIISFIASIGILIGNYLATKIDSKKLKPAFGWFVLTMGVYILVKEIIFK
ncbi:MAG TPA: sulfite exporter TauE/SafE family protein [Bacteroidia bacterium]|jgi:hypothetical protein|nr:sulfite exporter TauE/SafE family protein [Bacteroidia bacterium]